jgi:hypothetical protein
MRRRHPLLVAAILSAAPLLAASPAAAQPQATQGRGGSTGKIGVDFVELRAGPGNGYLSKGRAYQGDEVNVLNRDPGGDWLEVESGGVKGWVKAGTVLLQAKGAAPSAGRDRRQNNYTYDAQGRRVFADGTAMGSGEGIGEHDDTPVGDTARTDPGAVRLRVAFGGARISRDWTAGIEPDSALARLGVNATAISTEVEVSYDALPWLQLRALFRDARLSEAVVPPNEGFGFPDGLGIDVNSQQAELDATARYALSGGKGHIGGYLGGHLFRHAFQETRPFALFLSNTFIGLGAGLAADWKFGSVEAVLRGGILKPFAVAQSPAESGDPSALGGQANLEVAWWFAERWAVAANAHFMVMQTDWSGPSTHADPYTGPQPRNYEAAREEDQVVGGGLGIRFRP